MVGATARRAATVVGIDIEAPAMLILVKVCLGTRARRGKAGKQEAHTGMFQP